MAFGLLNVKEDNKLSVTRRAYKDPIALEAVESQLPETIVGKILLNKIIIKLRHSSTIDVDTSEGGCVIRKTMK